MSTAARTPELTALPNTDEPFLPPIEKPGSPILRFIYSMSRRQYGKVMTPFKVFVARMPLAFGQFIGKIGQLDKKLTLPRETVMLIREQVAHINVCLFCIDIGRYYTIKAAMNQAKFDALENYRTSPLFTEPGARRPRLRHRAHPRQKNRPRHLRPPPQLLLRARNLRDRLARRQRARLQHQQHRTQHPLRPALRPRPQIRMTARPDSRTVR